jgi:hypothetical protein
VRRFFTFAATTVALNCGLFAGQPFGASRLKAATIQDDGAQFESSSMQVRFSMAQPNIESLDIDGLGLSKRGTNVMRAVAMTENAGYAATTSTTAGGKEVEYRRAGQPADEAPAWTIQLSDRQIKLISQWSESENPQPIRFVLDTSRCHTTLLGTFNSQGGIQLPTVMHLPGEGDFRMTARRSSGSVNRKPVGTIRHRPWACPIIGAAFSCSW